MFKNRLWMVLLVLLTTTALAFGADVIVEAPNLLRVIVPGLQGPPGPPGEPGPPGSVAFLNGTTVRFPVNTVFGRNGDVRPEAGDYTAAQVGADPAGTAAATLNAHITAYKHSNIPNDNQTAAMVGTYGTPSVSNKFVTATDPSNTNARTPVSHNSTHGANGSDPISISTSQVVGLTASLAGKQSTLSNAATLGKITESGNLPLWNGGAWPGGGGGGDMYKATYDPLGRAVDVYSRTNHIGTQPVSTITGLSASATTDTTTTANITDSVNKRFVTDAQRSVLINTSGTNSGDVTLGTTPNGLSLSGQQMSLGLSSNSTTGALSASDHALFANGASLASTALQPTGSQSQTIGVGVDVNTALAINSASNTSAALAATPADTDYFGFLSGVWKKVTWANIKTLLASVFALIDNPTFTTAITTPMVNSNAIDGTHRLNVRNGVARSYTPVEGDVDTDAAGKLWIYTSGVWVEKGSYTLPAASASTLGGVKVGSGLAIDGSGVLSATAVSSSGTGSGMTVQAPFSGTQTIRTGSVYTADGVSRFTFRNHSSGRIQIKAKAATTLVPDSATSGIFWDNPINPFASYSSLRGYSVTVPAGTYVDLVSYGSGVFQAVMTTQNMARTGVNEYPYYGDITFYHNCNALGAATKASGNATVAYNAMALDTSTPITGTGSWSFSGASFASADFARAGNIDYTAGRIGFYYRPAASTLSSYEILWTAATGDGSDYNWALRRETGGQIDLKWSAGVTSVLSAQLVAGTAYYVEIEFNGTVATLYVDGTPVGSATRSGAVPTTTNSSIGYHQGTAQTHGTFDQLIISNDHTRSLYAIRGITSF